MKTNRVVESLVQKYIENHPNTPLSEVVKHFVAIGFSRASVYRWAKSAQQPSESVRKVRRAYPVRIATKGNIQKLKQFFDHKSGRSQRSFAKRLGCSQAYISHMLKKHTDIRCYKKTKRPLMTDKQMAEARPKCRAMYNKYKNTDFVIDDESYFLLSHNDLPGNDCFYSSDRSETPDKVMCDYQAKFPSKLLVWLAISPKGVSKPYFRRSGMAINQTAYLEILKNNLEPFILSNYKQGGYVFWPDLASSHYAHSVQDYLKSKGIPLVPKDINPANVPKARPIEDFWGNLKAKVYEGDWKANSLEELRRRIEYCLKNLDLKFVQHHMLGVRTRLGRIMKYGIP